MRYEKKTKFPVLQSMNPLEVMIKINTFFRFFSLQIP